MGDDGMVISMSLKRWSVFCTVSSILSVVNAVSVPGLEFVKRQTTGTAPVVWAASQDWDGSDGPWSSFTLQLGTPPQVVKVFPSTSGYQTIVVLPNGCGTSDPEDCTDLRGRIFNPTESTSWTNNTANTTTQVYPNNIGKSVGFTSRGSFGFDDVTLGWGGAGGPTLKNQTVGGIVVKDSYLGQFGLAPRASNFTSFSVPVPSYLENLKAQNIIPSRSWAYTAGNQYRNNKVLGNLVLGGYDRSLFIPHDVVWNMNTRDLKDLTVQIEDIRTVVSSGGRRLIDTPFPAFLDSSVSWMYLPESACKLFEDAFNIRYHAQGNFYFLNDAEHERLLSLDPQITFTLGNLTAGANVKITLPYSAFDLEIKSPFVANPTRYFPLRRTNNTEAYTLGRVFFQEAYVIADYERGTFTVSQCDWNPAPKTEIVAISSLARFTKTTVPGGTDGQKEESKTPVGAIAGGVAGGAVALIAAGLGFWFWRKKKREQAEATGDTALSPMSNHSGAAPSATMGAPTDHKPELDGTMYEQPKTDITGKVELHERDSHKAELFGDESQRLAAYRNEKNTTAPVLHEMEGGGNRWTVYEADGRQVEIHEMPATEQVANELGTESSGHIRQDGSVANQGVRSHGPSPISPFSQISSPAGSPPQRPR